MAFLRNKTVYTSEHPVTGLLYTITPNKPTVSFIPAQCGNDLIFVLFVSPNENTKNRTYSDAALPLPLIAMSPGVHRALPTLDV